MEKSSRQNRRSCVRILRIARESEGKKASRKARYRSLKQQKGRVRALLHMVGEGIIFGIVYGIFWLIAGVMALRLKWLGERREKRYDFWQDN